MIHLKYLAFGCWQALKAALVTLLILGCGLIITGPVILVEQFANGWWLALYSPVGVFLLYAWGAEAYRGREGRRG